MYRNVTRLDIMPPMRSKRSKSKHSGRRGDPVILYPLTPDEAMRAVLSISKEDARRIVESKPGKKRK